MQKCVKLLNSPPPTPKTNSNKSNGEEKIEKKNKQSQQTKEANKKQKQIEIIRFEHQHQLTTLRPKKTGTLIVWGLGVWPLNFFRDPFGLEGRSARRC